MLTPYFKLVCQKKGRAVITQKIGAVIEILDKLINLTEQDITDIKAAKHSGVEQSVKSKNELIEAFSKAKREADYALAIASDNGRNKNLDEILGSEGLAKLNEFREKLRTFQAKNKEYAKLVLVVKNYFDGLINAMFGGGDSSYGNNQTNFDSLFKIKV